MYKSNLSFHTIILLACRMVSPQEFFQLRKFVPQHPTPPPFGSLHYVGHAVFGRVLNYDVQLIFPTLISLLPQPFSFWADGYFAETVGQVNEEIVKRYIRQQEASRWQIKPKDRNPGIYAGEGHLRLARHHAEVNETNPQFTYSSF